MSKEVDEDIKKKLDQIAQEMDAQDEDTKRLFEELDLNKYVTSEENEFASSSASSSSMAAAASVPVAVDTEPSAIPSLVKEADYLRARPSLYSEDEEGYKRALNEIERISTAFSHLQSQYTLERGKNEHLIKLNMEMEKKNVNMTVEMERMRKEALSIQGANTLLEVDIREKDTVIQGLRSQITNQSRALDERDNDVMKMKVELERVNAELQHMKMAYKAREKEVEAASIDIVNMTRENRAMHEQSQMLRNERDRLFATNDELKQRSIKLSAAVEQTKIELQDQRLMYKKVCDENARLKESLQNLSTSRDDSLDLLHKHESESVRLRDEIESLEESSKVMRQELDRSQTYASDLARRLRAAEARITLLEEERIMNQRTSAATAAIPFSSDISKRINIPSINNNYNNDENNNFSVSSAILSGDSSDKGGSLMASSNNTTISGLSSSNNTDITGLTNGSAFTDSKTRKRDLEKEARKQKILIDRLASKYNIV